MRLNEIFLSVDGEVNKWGQGTWSTFVRLQGCNLRCCYCDTVRAQEWAGGEDMSQEQILKRVQALGCRKVTITGGEPLTQFDECLSLLRALRWSEYRASVETNGSISIAELVHLANVIVDYKLPSSGMEDNMSPTMFSLVKGDDWIKFVIKNRVDYERAKEVLNQKYMRGQAAFSACAPDLQILELLKWMKEDKLFWVRVNVQLHKLIGMA